MDQPTEPDYGAPETTPAPKKDTAFQEALTAGRLLTSPFPEGGGLTPAERDNILETNSTAQRLHDADVAGRSFWSHAPDIWHGLATGALWDSLGGPSFKFDPSYGKDQQEANLK